MADRPHHLQIQPENITPPDGLYKWLYFKVKLTDPFCEDERIFRLWRTFLESHLVDELLDVDQRLRGRVRRAHNDPEIYIYYLRKRDCPEWSTPLLGRIIERLHAIGLKPAHPPSFIARALSLNPRQVLAPVARNRLPNRPSHPEPTPPPTPQPPPPILTRVSTYIIEEPGHSEGNQNPEQVIGFRIVDHDSPVPNRNGAHSARHRPPDGSGSPRTN